MAEPTPEDGTAPAIGRGRGGAAERGHTTCGATRRSTTSSQTCSLGSGPERIHFVEGKVEDTIPAHAPERIALLRLDTDWYESTRHELEHLYPRLSRGGVLIIDDYGHWQGARQAVDEYFGDAHAALLNRIDYTARASRSRSTDAADQPQAPGFSLQYCSNRSAGLPCGGGASFSGVSDGLWGSSRAAPPPAASRWRDRPSWWWAWSSPPRGVAGDVVVGSDSSGSSRAVLVDGSSSPPQPATASASRRAPAAGARARGQRSTAGSRRPQ